MKCNGLRTSCRKCGRRFDQHDRTENCPDCGESRKCNRGAVPGYKFCPVHGGPNPSNNFYGLGRGIVTGATSNFPLTRLAAKRNELVRDGVFMSNRHAIDMIRKRVNVLMERIDLQEAPDRMRQLVSLWSKFRSADARGDELEKVKIGARIDGLMDAIFHDYSSWDEIYKALDLDRKMVESEVKIAKDLQAILTAEDAYELVAEIFAAIIRLEDDPKKLKAYQYEFTRIIGDRPDEQTRGSSGTIITEG